MTTTALFVEILVVGLQALLWLAIVVSIGSDLGPVLTFLKDYKEYAALITTVLLAVAYALGIFIDRAADSFCTLFMPKPDKSLPESVGKLRLRILHESESMGKFLDYQRSRLRIARSTVFNLFLMIVAASVWIVWRAPLSAPYLWTIFAGVVAFGAAVAVTLRIDKAQLDRLADGYNIITEEKESNGMSRRVVAAICYRKKQGPVEFLLVRTTGGKHWTFPKGHVEEESSELPWLAAKREADEEAGVSGRIEMEPLTSYLYPKGKHGHEDLVTAYLMLVEAQGKPHELDREPQWFTPEGAMQKLAKGREERYMREHEKVIKAALSKLNGK